MDRTIVIYKSKYGATEKYAQLIGQEIDCPVVSADDFNKKDFEKYIDLNINKHGNIYITNNQVLFESIKL